MDFENKDNPQGRMKRLGQVAVVLRPDRSQFICMCIDAYFNAKKVKPTKD